MGETYHMDGEVLHINKYKTNITISQYNKYYYVITELFPICHAAVYSAGFCLYTNKLIQTRYLRKLLK